MNGAAALKKRQIKRQIKQPPRNEKLERLGLQKKGKLPRKKDRKYKKSKKIDLNQ